MNEPQKKGKTFHFILAKFFIAWSFFFFWSMVFNLTFEGQIFVATMLGLMITVLSVIWNTKEVKTLTDHILNLTGSGLFVWLMIIFVIGATTIDPFRFVIAVIAFHALTYIY